MCTLEHDHHHAAYVHLTRLPTAARTEHTHPAVVPDVVHTLVTNLNLHHSNIARQRGEQHMREMAKVFFTPTVSPMGTLERGDYDLHTALT